MYWVQFVYVQEKTETLSKEEHMFPGLHLCKKDIVPETVLNGVGGGTILKSHLFYTGRLLGTFLSYCLLTPDQIALLISDPGNVSNSLTEPDEPDTLLPRRSQRQTSAQEQH